MTHGSLFSGIGGFDLAAEWMGWENVFHCEWNEFGKRVLKYYWPNTTSYDDITKTDFTIWRGRVDVLSGGFPCQPYSQAGKRLGKEDERHLWPEMRRAIRECQPTWVVGENVRGLVNWNGGVVFDEVQADLEAEGYEILPFILPACGKNAPHRRERVWFVAYRNGIGCDNGSNNRQERPIHNNEQQNTAQGQSERKERKCGIRAVCGHGATPNPDGNGQHERDGHNEINTGERGQYAQCDAEPSDGNGFTSNTDSRRQPSKKHGKTQSGRLAKTSVSGNWKNFPTQSPICGGDDGLPTKLDGITFSKWRNESIKAYGNAVVPQVVYEIFKVIESIN